MCVSTLRYVMLREMLEQKERDVLATMPSKSTMPELQDVDTSLGYMNYRVLVRIREALDKLEQDTYGYCISCEGEIRFTILKEVFQAVRCDDCYLRRTGKSYDESFAEKKDPETAHT